MLERITYRIYTENLPKNLPKLRKILDNLLDGYTILKGDGFWQGVREKSLIIEYVGELGENYKLECVASQVREANNQQSVILTSELIRFMEVK